MESRATWPRPIRSPEAYRRPCVLHPSTSCRGFSAPAGSWWCWRSSPWVLQSRLRRAAAIGSSAMTCLRRPQKWMRETWRMRGTLPQPHRPRRPGVVPAMAPPAAALRLLRWPRAMPRRCPSSSIGRPCFPAFSRSMPRPRAPGSSSTSPSRFRPSPALPSGRRGLPDDGAGCLRGWSPSVTLCHAWGLEFSSPLFLPLSPVRAIGRSHAMP